MNERREQSEVAVPMPTTRRALVRRINRKLAAKTDQGNWVGERLRASRSAAERNNLGDYYILDVSRNMVIAHHVDPTVLYLEVA